MDGVKEDERTENEEVAADGRDGQRAQPGLKKDSGSKETWTAKTKKTSECVTNNADQASRRRAWHLDDSYLLDKKKKMSFQ